eukprot:CAMPEP_0119123556 /NCGR_PEP_ID=MMETSP1310-20130426/3470_1 /TAXON_ID=464262 /ORGANISM="Genus nov. species nov., Strain RCC2339" /LENGTH=281 /DNA_ID=CAMNT_0007113399 /DNA_START=53 /DNA_END=898 /DNA_ORIENTATION=-
MNNVTGAVEMVLGGERAEGNYLLLAATEDGGLQASFRDHMDDRRLEMRLSSDGEISIQMQGKRAATRPAAGSGGSASGAAASNTKRRIGYCKMTIIDNQPEIVLGALGEQPCIAMLANTKPSYALKSRNALLSLVAGPGQAGVSIADKSGHTRATFGWYDLQKTSGLQMEQEGDVTMLQMSGHRSCRDLNVFPEITLSVIENVGQFVSARHYPEELSRVHVMPNMQEQDEEEVNMIINVEKDGPQIGLICDNTIKKISTATTSAIISAFGLKLDAEADDEE